MSQIFTTVFFFLQNRNCCYPTKREEVSVPEKLVVVETLHKGKIDEVDIAKDVDAVELKLALWKENIVEYNSDSSFCEC